MSHSNNSIWRWLVEAYRVCRREFTLTFNDKGVVIFFLLLCAVYPVLYSLIYNTEVEHNMPVVVIDDCRSQLSRELARRLDATPEVAVVAYAATMQEARDMLARKQAYGIVAIPREFEQKVGLRQQAHITVVADMGLMFRYKNILTAATNVTQEMGADILHEAVAPVLYNHGAVIENRQVPIGNTGMGLASAILLFILPLVIQQSMLLGIGMLHGGSIERRRRNAGIDPLEVEARPGATLVGKMVCYQFIYILPVIYALYLVPVLFDFPQNASLFSIVVLAVPFIIASAMMGQVLRAFVNERESVFLLMVFTSVVFVFLTGASWPRHEMSRFWLAVGDCVPATWMCNAYVLMQSDGATLRSVTHQLSMLWLHCGIFTALAYVVERWVNRPRYRNWQEKAASSPTSLQKYDLYKHGIG